MSSGGAMISEMGGKGGILLGRKLHESERNWTGVGWEGAHVPCGNCQSRGTAKATTESSLQKLLYLNGICTILYHYEP